MLSRLQMQRFFDLLPDADKMSMVCPPHLLGSDLICGNIKNSLAPSTWQGYKMAWFSWIIFLNINQLVGAVLTEQIVLSFLTTLMAKKYSRSHVNKILCGVSFFLKLKGYQSLFSFFSLKQAMKGYKRKKIAVYKIQPITPELLKKTLCGYGKHLFFQICGSTFQGCILFLCCPENFGVSPF